MGEIVEIRLVVNLVRQTFDDRQDAGKASQHKKLNSSKNVANWKTTLRVSPVPAVGRENQTLPQMDGTERQRFHQVCVITKLQVVV